MNETDQEDFEIENVSSAFEDTGEDDDIPLQGSFAPMVFDVTQRRVRDLNQDYANRELDPRPSFQRGYVWDRSKASRLIESVLLNVPLPLVYTAEEEDGTEVVIDGQQRLLTVFGFISGKFPRDDKPFRLTKLKLLTHLNGKTFNDLDDLAKRKFLKFTIQVIKISSQSHSDVRFEIFERLNSGAVKLNAQELRNCIYRGPFNDVLRDLSQDKAFRECIGQANALERMQDAELVLRFLAFYDKTFLNYPGGMKSFLNEYMDDKRHSTKEKLQKSVEAFKKASELSFSVFGRNAFRRFSVGSGRSPAGHWEKTLNRALYDITMWGFSQYEKRQVIPKSDEIRDAFIDLMQSDPEFRESVTSATGDKGRTRYRFEAWKKILESIIEAETSEKRLFTREQRWQLFQTNKFCSLCEQKIVEFDDAEVDHKLAFAKGGHTTLDNAQLTHRFCNRAKSTN